MKRITSTKRQLEAARLELSQARQGSPKRNPRRLKWFTLLFQGLQAWRKTFVRWQTFFAVPFLNRRKASNQAKFQTAFKPVFSTRCKNMRSQSIGRLKPHTTRCSGSGQNFHDFARGNFRNAGRTRTNVQMDDPASLRRNDRIRDRYQHSLRLRRALPVAGCWRWRSGLGVRKVWKMIYFDWEIWRVKFLTRYDQRHGITRRTLLLGPLRVWWTL